MVYKYIPTYVIENLITSKNHKYFGRLPLRIHFCVIVKVSPEVLFLFLSVYVSWKGSNLNGKCFME